MTRTPMTADELRTAWSRGLRPEAPGANLSGANLTDAYLTGANLSGANLSGANLSGANLSRADLSRADLYGANLADANLSGAYLSGANLSGANLSGANLTDAYLSGANLSRANLSGANLSRANLSGANLSDARGVLCIDGLPSGRVLVVPTGPDAHELWIGCWAGTTTELRAMVASDEGWPEARGDECARRRPSLLGVADLVDAWLAMEVA